MAGDWAPDLTAANSEVSGASGRFVLLFRWGDYGIQRKLRRKTEGVGSTVDGKSTASGRPVRDLASKPARLKVWRRWRLGGRTTSGYAESTRTKEWPECDHGTGSRLTVLLVHRCLAGTAVAPAHTRRRTTLLPGPE